jgi:mannose-binding lectin 2
MMVLIVLLIFAITLFGKAEKIPELSFQAPFDDMDHAGDRMVSRLWRTAGSTAVSSNFVRLTPDRQSKKGAVWSRKGLEVKSMSSILKFRISGTGKQFFGDGLAMWVTTQGYYLEGDLHGFQEKFTGIGIIFDTFKNSENLHAHRDVTVLVNDGEKR